MFFNFTVVITASNRYVQLKSGLVNVADFHSARSTERKLVVTFVAVVVIAARSFYPGLQTYPTFL